jgi:hypothetical protein
VAISDLWQGKALSAAQSIHDNASQRREIQRIDANLHLRDTLGKRLSRRTAVKAALGAPSSLTTSLMEKTARTLSAHKAALESVRARRGCGQIGNEPVARSR